MNLNLRFRSEDDAMLFLFCYLNKKKPPAHIMVWPFIQVGRLVIINPEYKACDYEFIPCTHTIKSPTGDKKK
jgi:hypothetical protein